MVCERLKELIKSWYFKVQEELMAPARMVAFMEKHITQCEICQADPDVKSETGKIREIVLPPSKVPKPKVVKSKDGDDDDEADEVEDDVEDEVEDDEDVDTSDDIDEEEEEDIEDEDDFV